MAFTGFIFYNPARPRSYHSLKLLHLLLHPLADQNQYLSVSCLHKQWSSKAFGVHDTASYLESGLLLSHG